MMRSSLIRIPRSYPRNYTIGMGKETSQRQRPTAQPRALGGRGSRSFEIIAYNSCRNRHCPKCQGAAAQDWLAAREADLLPVGYFHLVFTLPAEIAPIAYQNKAVVYDLLFRAAAETLLTIAADPRHLGARIGFTAVVTRCLWLSTEPDQPKRSASAERMRRVRERRRRGTRVVMLELYGPDIAALTQLGWMASNECDRETLGASFCAFVDQALALRVTPPRRA
jgi:hypothetical protein